MQNLSIKFFLPINKILFVTFYYICDKKVRFNNRTQKETFVCKKQLTKCLSNINVYRKWSCSSEQPQNHVMRIYTVEVASMLRLRTALFTRVQKEIQTKEIRQENEY